jgi:cholesterol oxidase
MQDKADTFQAGWPPEIRLKTLKEHYGAVGEMLEVETVPTNQWPERTKLLYDAAQRVGFGDRFRQLDLAVRFDKNWNYKLTDPHGTQHSIKKPNAHGREQGTCVHLGNCDIGCDVSARNTLDLNYLASAENDKAEILPLHLVRYIQPSSGGYTVHFNEIVGTQLKPGQVTGGLVILAASSLGSTEILLRSRDEYKTLPDVSQQLGRGWSSNGDFLTPAIHPFRRVSPTRGPTITAAIDLLDGEYRGESIFVEDGGFPDVAREYLQGLAEDSGADPQVRRMVASILPLIKNADLFKSVMPWFAQSRDASDGVLSLKDGRLWLDWDPSASEKTLNAVAAVHRKLAFASEGMPLTPLTWTVGKSLITPHPLGGCRMGTSAADGVVDHKGGVFNYKNLYVADGAIIPKAIGLNPSRTIAALAERVAAELLKDLGA